jgi:hypothetical protein
MTEASLYEALEVCLQALDQGQSLDSVLKLYPGLESELRPILNASLQARTLAVPSVPSDVQRRGRARLLQRAAEMRESKRTPSKRVISFFPRLALTFSIAAALILSSTGLVSASSNSLPGDQLYSVKRTWENVQLAFVFNEQGREVLQSEFEQERLNEIDELLIQNRSQSVTFSGLVLKRQDGTWLVSGVPVQVTDKTRLISSQIADNVPVKIIGITNSKGVLEADEIQALAPGSMLPPLEPSNNEEEQKVVPTVAPINTISTPIAMQTPAAPSATPQSFVFTGIVQKQAGKVWTINGQAVSVDQATINGAIQIGSEVRFEGYYSNNGDFIVTSIEINVSSTPFPSNHNHGGNGGDDKGGDNGGDG